MQLVERRVIKSNHSIYKQIDEMCFASKNLYNSANFIVRQTFFFGGQNQVPRYESLYHIMKDSEQYKTLPAKISQQVLKLLAQNWTSFFAVLAEYGNDSSKFKGEQAGNLVLLPEEAAEQRVDAETQRAERLAARLWELGEDVWLSLPYNVIGRGFQTASLLPSIPAPKKYH